MADDNGAAGALASYRETAIAFDDLIVQVGRAVARAQELMDLRQADFQRQVARALREGRLRRLDVPPASAFTLPETKLELKIGLSMRYPEGGGPPSLAAVPLNATSTNQNDIDVEAATEVRLRFVSVPPSEETSGPPPSALAPDAARELARGDGDVAAWLEQLGELTVDLDYADAPRLWTVAHLGGREPSLVTVVDDRRGKRIGWVARRLPPTAEELEPVGVPRLSRVEPGAGRQGEILTVHGDNFLTLAGQTVLEIDGRPIPPLRLAMRTLAFKVPSWATLGDVEVKTPLGATGESGRRAFTPLPGFHGFEPRRGYYDTVRRRGTSLTVFGSNLRAGCGVRFAGGALSENVEVVSPGRMQVEVPPDAGSGPLTLVYGEHPTTRGELFLLLPRIDRMSPRQARVGDEVVLTGSSLAAVAEVEIGQASVPRTSFLLQAPEHLRFRVPSGATDGPVRVREVLGPDLTSEAVTRDVFYVVPRITGFAEPVVTPGRLLTVFGEGLDPEADMMTLLFYGRGGVSEAPVLAVAADRGSLTTRVPSDAATGFVLLLRKRVYSEHSPADTSDLSRNKLTVLTAEGDPSDLVLEERFEDDLSRWSVEAGSWQIDQGVLLSEGTARLGMALPEASERLTLYADVLRAERFGFSLTPSGGGARLQVWIDLAAANPALTWSTVDERGHQSLLGGVPMALLPGGHHLLQLSFADGRAAVSLDQEEVHAHDWGEGAVERIALLADSAAQRWDNVVILKRGDLSLPEPDFYRFGGVPEPPVPPSLRVDTLTPARGPEGTEVTLEGIGLDEAARFFFGGREAEVLEAAGSRARVVVPEDARTGSIEVHGRGGVVTTSGEPFVLPPKILDLVPTEVLAGEALHVLGTNLPTGLDTFTVRVLGQPARVVAAGASTITVLVPDAVGSGAVEVAYEGFVAQAPSTVEVRREEVLLDLVAAAEHAVWTTAGGVVEPGVLGEAGAASVQLRTSERLEDDRVHGPVLYVHPPDPSQRALRGEYPPFDFPAGRLELRLDFGMLYSAAPAAEEAADADGVALEVTFLSSVMEEETPLLPRITCVHDGFLERFVLDAAPLAGQRGQLVVSVYAGRTGLRDDTAVARGELLQLT